MERDEDGRWRWWSEIVGPGTRKARVEIGLARSRRYTNKQQIERSDFNWWYFGHWN